MINNNNNLTNDPGTSVLGHGPKRRKTSKQTREEPTADGFVAERVSATADGGDIYKESDINSESNYKKSGLDARKKVSFDMSGLSSLLKDIVSDIQPVNKLVSTRVEHMDSGCSQTMTGDESILVDVHSMKNTKEIVGFNNSNSVAVKSGLNQDGMDTLVVPGMPKDRDLLSAWQYTKEGVIVFFSHGGYVVKMTKEQQKNFEEFLMSCDISMWLKLKNRTFVVDYRLGSKNVSESERGYIAGIDNCVDEELVTDVLDQDGVGVDESYQGYLANLCAEFPEVGSRIVEIEYRDLRLADVSAFVADVFFNGRVNYTTVDDMIMGYMLSGFTPRGLRSAVKNKSVGGMNPKITVEALNHFEREHGRSPDFFQMSRYASQGHQKAFDNRDKEPIVRVGQLVGVDHGYSDYNERAIGEEDPSRRPGEVTAGKRVEKLRTLGGASFFTLAVDYLTGFIVGRLEKPKDTSL